AAIASGAHGRIDDHRPCMALVGIGRIHGLPVRLLALDHTVRIPLILLEGPGVNDFAIASDIADTEALMFLRTGDRIRRLVRARDLRTNSATHGVRESHRIDVDTYPGLRW